MVSSAAYYDSSDIFMLIYVISHYTYGYQMKLLGNKDTISCDRFSLNIRICMYICEKVQFYSVISDYPSELE